MIETLMEQIIGKVDERVTKLETKNREEQTMENKNEKPPAYRDENGKLISLSEAKKRRWASKEDGMPTKIYELRLAKREAKRNGEEIPVRKWESKNTGAEYNGIESPFDLDRRSGQALVWQVLADAKDTPVTKADLNTAVNKIYAERFADYYNQKYNEQPFDAWTTAIVMSHAPSDAKIEAVNQRLDVDTVAETVVLLTNVTEPKTPKKRGRKPKAVVEIDEGTTVEVNAETKEVVNA
jgi:hypothetical protein